MIKSALSETPLTLLVDNGSYRAESTLSLRRIATNLSLAAGHPIHPVSLLHSTKVNPAELDGEPAAIFEPFIKQQLENDITSFLVVPLFFGHSAAIFEYLPQRVMDLKKKRPDLSVRIAPCMVDLEDPDDNAVAQVLAELVRKKIAEKNLQKPAVTLVDHGTPRIAVNQVRNFLANQLAELLKEEAGIVAASSMEMREEPEYAFNEPLLEHLLGAEQFDRDVILSMLFISPGRHAGPGGDIAKICEDAEETSPNLLTHMSDLFATHPKVTDVLLKKFQQGLLNDPVTSEVSPPITPK